MKAPVRWLKSTAQRKNTIIAGLALLGIAAHLVFRYVAGAEPSLYQFPLLLVLALGGGPLVYDLLRKVLRLEFGSDLLAGISIVTSILLGEYLAGTIVVLMLSGGEALEDYAVRNASSVLRALANRMPSIAHRKHNSGITDISIQDIVIGDTLVVFPHEICPVDGMVAEGTGVMDESFLTGEPFQMSKTIGASVISGAINGESALTITATKLPVDSRYAKIMEVMRASEQSRPRMRRLGDKLGSVYTPLAVGIAIIAWLMSGDPVRFLAVLVIATPCPLLIAIPVSIIGSISLCARRAIIVKDPVALEQIGSCDVGIFDKTGTLTYGRPALIEKIVAPGCVPREVLSLAASLEVYSKHPLAEAIRSAAQQEGVPIVTIESMSEKPGQGLQGIVRGRTVQITSRGKATRQQIHGLEYLPQHAGGLECLVAIDGHYAATFRFRDAPRQEGVSFISHLRPRHRYKRLMLVSGDRESEVRYLAEQVGITEIHAQKSPEEKLEIVRRETEKSKTVYVGDGINDAPAMMAATVGIAMGENSDITAEAAGVVIMEGALKRIDEFMHISRHMKSIALQSAVGGMALSVAGMFFAAAGYLTPVAGALAQEVIDVLAVLNALRAAFPPRQLSDF